MKKYTKILNALKLIAIAVALAISFYFWEQYLNQHFLGGYEPGHRAVQYSRPGFWFFIIAWPVWVYPLAVVLLFLISWKRRRIRSLHDHIRLIEQSRINLQAEVKALQEALERSGQVNPDQVLQNDYRRLREAYYQVNNDYLKSLQFIEKLVDKLPVSSP